MTHYRTKEEIAKEHLTQYYYHKGRGINLDDILPMSRILPMMEEYALPLKSEIERLKAELAEKKEQILMVKSHLGIANKEISELLSERVASGNSLREILPLSTEDRAVEFAEWLLKNSELTNSFKDKDGKLFWLNYEEEKRYFTSEELYKQFLEETSSNGERKQ